MLNGNSGWSEQWLSFLVWFDSLSGDLQERLEPLTQELTPLWDDPLWRAIIMVVMLLVLLITVFLFARWAVTRFVALATVTSTFLSAVLAFLAKPAGKVLHRVNGGVTGVRQAIKRREVLRRRMKQITSALRYLTTDQKWRYRTPWYLSIGEAGTDRNAFLKGVRQGRKTDLLNREKKLKVIGSEWLFYDKGVIIDVNDDVISDFATHPKGRNKLSSLLDLLLSRRPERAADGIILSLSAQTLLSANSEGKREQLGNQLFQQLWLIQKKIGFRLPVYLVIAKCEEILGFESFWQVQSQQRRDELFGWSNSNQLETAYNREWVDQAFDSVMKGLQTAQLMVAASNKAIPNVDEYMLHHQYFERLHEPLKSVLDGVFANTVFHLPMPLRGIYFTGNVAGQATCVEELLQEKLFEERNLALPVSKIHLSKEITWRRFQLTTGVLGGMLVIGLMTDSYRLYQYNQSFKRVVEQMHTRLQPTKCSPLGSSVFRALNYVDEIGVHPFYPTFIGSWFNFQFEANQQFIADNVLTDYVFRDMECRLGKRADVLNSELATTPHHTSPVQQQSSANASMLRQGQSESDPENGFGDINAKVGQFYKNRQWFLQLSGPLVSTNLIEHKFVGLLNYLYDQPDSNAVDKITPLLIGAIKVMNFAPGFATSGNQMVNDNKVISGLISSAQQSQRALLNEPAEYPVIGNKNQSALEQIQALGQLQVWVETMRNRWLVPYQSSPCGVNQKQMAKTLQTLEYADVLTSDKKQELESLFSFESCYSAIKDTLLATRIFPFNQVFTKKNELLYVAQELRDALPLLTAMQNLSFVKKGDETTSTGATSEPVIAWQASSLQLAINEITEYQNFVSAYVRRGEITENNDLQSMFEGLLKSLLMRHVAYLIEQAKVTMSEQQNQSGTTNKRISDTTESLLAASVDQFSQVQGSITLLDQLLGQLGEKSTRLALQQSARQYVQRQFDRLDQVVKEEKLLVPDGSPDWYAENFALALYPLGNNKELSSYVDKEQDRISILAFAYAEPMLNYLLNSGGISAAGGSAAQWQNTIHALNLVQRKNTDNDLSYFKKLVTVSLVDEDNSDCQTVNTTSDLAMSDSLFAERYHQVERLIGNHCKSATKDGLKQQLANFSKQFNQRLAGRFPFADVKYAGKREATFQAVEGFFSQYDPQSLITQINRVNKKQPGAVPSSWPSFLQSLLEFKQWLDAGQSAGSIGWNGNVNVTFDVIPQGPGADQIISWQLSSGKHLASFPNGNEQIPWSVGESLQLTLTWANSSAYTPYTLKAVDGVSINSQLAQAEFSSKGDWAMFEWLLHYASPQLKAQTAQADNTDLLAFPVPVSLKTDEPQKRKVAYVSQPSITVETEYLDKNGVLQALKWPLSLPSSAPGGL